MRSLKFAAAVWFVGACPMVSGAVIYDEAISGDIAGAFPARTEFTFELGSNTVLGTSTVSGNGQQTFTLDQDSFLFVIPDGAHLAAFSVRTDSEIPAGPGLTDLQTVFSIYPCPPCGVPVSVRAIDLLGGVSQSFDSPLGAGAGHYSLAHAYELGGPFAEFMTTYAYRLDFTLEAGPPTPIAGAPIPAPIPEPPVLWLFAVAAFLAGFPFSRRSLDRFAFKWCVWSDQRDLLDANAVNSPAPVSPCLRTR